VRFRRRADTVQLLKDNVRFMATADSALMKSVDLSYAPSVAYSFKIESERGDSMLVDLGAFVNAFGSGVVLPFLLIYLHNVRGIPFGLAGTAAAVQSAAALASGFLGGTLSDRLGPKRVLMGSLAVMTVAFALMPLIHTAWHAFAIYTLWGIGSGAFWPSQAALLAGLAPAARRAQAYGLQRLAMNAGVALGGVAAGLIASVGHPQTFTVLFAIPRTAGWLAQWEELLEDPEEKIARPRQVYLGSSERAFVPMEKR